MFRCSSRVRISSNRRALFESGFARELIDVEDFFSEVERLAPSRK